MQNLNDLTYDYASTYGASTVLHIYRFMYSVSVKQYKLYYLRKFSVIKPFNTAAPGTGWDT